VEKMTISRRRKSGEQNTKKGGRTSIHSFLVITKKRLAQGKSRRVGSGSKMKGGRGGEGMKGNPRLRSGGGELKVPDYPTT